MTVEYTLPSYLNSTFHHHHRREGITTPIYIWVQCKDYYAFPCGAAVKIQADRSLKLKSPGYFYKSPAGLSLQRRQLTGKTQQSACLRLAAIPRRSCWQSSGKARSSAHNSLKADAVLRENRIHGRVVEPYLDDLSQHIAVIAADSPSCVTARFRVSL